MDRDNIHGSAIALGALGILVRGPARSGKSAVCLSALRRGASLGLQTRLVADDRVILSADGQGAVMMRAPETLFGLIEISGVGIIREPAIAEARLGLVADLLDPPRIERLPTEDAATVSLGGILLRRIRLPCRSAAFAADVLVSLALAGLPAELVPD